MCHKKSIHSSWRYSPLAIFKIMKNICRCVCISAAALPYILSLSLSVSPSRQKSNFLKLQINALKNTPERTALAMAAQSVYGEEKTTLILAFFFCAQWRALFFIYGAVCVQKYPIKTTLLWISKHIFYPFDYIGARESKRDGEWVNEWVAMVISVREGKKCVHKTQHENIWVICEEAFYSRRAYG